MNSIALSYFICSCINIVLSLFVFLKNKNNKINQSFSFIALLLGSWLMCWSAAFTYYTHTLVITRIMVVISFFLPVAFNMFANFINHKDYALNKIEFKLHSILLSLFICFSWSDYNIKSANINNGNLEFSFGFIYNLLGLYIAFLIGYSLYKLIFKLRNSDYELKQRRKYLTLGILLGTSHAIIFSFILPVLGYVTLNKFSPFSTIWLVGFIAYAITKHQLMNINILISKSVSYVITGSVYIGGIWLGYLIKEEFFEKVMISTFFTVLGALILGMFFNKLQKVIENKTPIQYLKGDDISKLSKEIIDLYVDCYDIHGVTKKTLSFLNSNLHVSNTLIFVNPEFLGGSVDNTTNLVNINNPSETFSITNTPLTKTVINLEDKKELSEDMVLISEKYNAALMVLVIKDNQCLMNILIGRSSKLVLNNINPSFFYLISSQLKIVLERIKPYEQVRKEFLKSQKKHINYLKKQSILEAEYKLAKQIQERFLPKDFIDIAGIKFDFLYNPSRYVGGDFFEVRSIGKEKLGILICDITGKGLESCFTTIQMYSIFKYQISSNDSPKMIMDVLNNALYELRTQKNHCAAFYLELDLHTKILKYSDAGNGLCYILRNKTLINLTEYGGMILGACQNSIYTEGEIHLENNDIIFMSTDGVLDMKNPSGERFGYQRLENLILSLDNQPNKKEFLSNELHTFSDSSTFFADDVTIITLAIE